jgi:hypothetical protein
VVHILLNIDEIGSKYKDKEEICVKIQSFSKIVFGIGLTMALAVWCLPAQAAIYTWVNTDPTGNWNTLGDWSNSPTGQGPDGANTALITGDATHNETVALTTAIGATTPLTALTVGGGATTNDILNINSPGSLKVNSLTLNGGTINGNSALTVNTSTTGFGTLNNGTINGSINNNSSTLGFNFQNVTLNNVSLTGSSISAFSHPLSDVFNNNWGNNSYGLFNISGNSSITGTFASGGQQVLHITNGTLTFNPSSTPSIQSYSTQYPPLFVLGSNGNLNIASSSTVTLGTSEPIPINGGTLSHTGTGTFNAYAMTGYGTISGPMNVNGGITAQGGTLIVDSTSGKTINGTSASWGAGTGGILDLRNNINLSGTPGLFPGGTGIVQLDGVNLTGSGVSYLTGNTNTPSNTTQVVNNGVNNGISTLNGSWTNMNKFIIENGAQLNIASGSTLNNTGVLDFQIAGNGQSGLSGVLDNMGSFTGTGDVTFDLTSLTHQAGGEQWEFFEGSGWGEPTANITALGLASGLTWEIDSVQGGEIFKLDATTVAATPEPGTMILMGLGLAGAALMKRRQAGANT